ncbi:MAG TPA: hypothetical protein VF911_01365, partial [Thermoanaerobaculia bacterium]
MNIIKVVLEILTGVSGLAGLVSFVFALQGRSADKLSRPLGFALAISFTVVSLLSAIAGREKARTAEPIAAPPAPAQLISPVEVRVNVNAEAPDVATVADRRQQMKHQRVTPANIPAPASATPSQAAPLRNVITTIGDAGALPAVGAIADDALHMLQRRFSEIRGEVHSSQSVPDEDLQGLITTDLTLNVSVVGASDVVQRR